MPISTGVIRVGDYKAFFVLLLHRHAHTNSTASTFTQRARWNKNLAIFDKAAMHLPPARAASDSGAVERNSCKTSPERQQVFGDFDSDCRKSTFVLVC
jgi:hypothetical protein